MDYKPLEIIVPTSVRRDDVRLYRVSTAEDVDKAFDLFAEDFPKLYEYMEKRDAFSIANFISMMCSLTPSREDFERIPFNFENTDRKLYRRIKGDRVHTVSPINACIDLDHWNCVYGVGLITAAYRQAGIDFEIWSQVFPNVHPVISVPSSNQNFSLKYSNADGSYLESEDMGKIDGVLFGKDAYPIPIHSDSVLGFTILELVMMTYKSILNTDSLENVQNAIQNLEKLIDSYQGLSEFYGLPEKIGVKRILPLRSIEQKLLNEQ